MSSETSAEVNLSAVTLVDMASSTSYKLSLNSLYISLLSACCCHFSATGLRGGVLGLPPLWIKQRNTVGIASGFKRFFIGNAMASR